MFFSETWVGQNQPGAGLAFVETVGLRRGYLDPGVCFIDKQTSLLHFAVS